MKSSRYFIIEAEQTHKDKEGSIYVLERFENQQKVRQFQKIVSVPERHKGLAEVGDLLCIHFNVLRYERKNGVKTLSPNHLIDDLYYVPDNMAHFILKADGTVSFLKNDCIVEGRIGKEEEITKSGIILPDNRHVMAKKADIMDGYIWSKSDKATDIEIGDKVCMEKYSDYEIEFPDGERRWLVPYESIMFKYEL